MTIISTCHRHGTSEFIYITGGQLHCTKCFEEAAMSGFVEGHESEEEDGQQE